VIVAVDPLPVEGLIPLTFALFQANVAVLLVLVATYVFSTLLHQFIVAALVITEVGLTVAVTVNEVPTHPSTVGVIT